MITNEGRDLSALTILLQAHPWHGVSMGLKCPEVVTCYVEMVPTDTVKYELDKVSGLLRIDRPQKYSNAFPCLYGFLPRTLCGDDVAARARDQSGALKGDDDPIDVCVLTDRVVPHGNILADVIPLGGLRMIDRGEVDDKIIAVLSGDATYGKLRDVSECPDAVLARLRHYFETYKLPPGETSSPCRILETYDRFEAHEVIRAGQADYARQFAGIPELVWAALQPFSKST